MSKDQLPVGQFVKSFPIAHVPEDTQYFAAGPLTIGVEYRVFDPVAERARLTQEEIDAAGPDSLFSSDDVDQGLSFHVFATEGLVEYLRYDCFADEPHYHYIVPGDGNQLVHYDPAANGPMVDWALQNLRTRTAEMLDAVGGADLLKDLDAKAWAAALDEAEASARKKVPATQG